MHGLIVYESMFGSTRQVAEAIAEGLRGTMVVQVVTAPEVGTVGLVNPDLLVVGAPMHAHGMPRPVTRKGAPDYIGKQGNELVLELGADSNPGIREWLAKLGVLHVLGAAFDTRLKAPQAFTGRASRGIAKALEDHGIAMACSPESFLVDKHSKLLPGEIIRAREWGERLARAVLTEAQTKP